MHLAALRIDAGHHVFDDAVLAGGVHALKHQQHGPLAMGIEPLLQVNEAGDPLGQDRLHVSDVGRETESLGGIVIVKLEVLRLIDPALLDDLFGDLGDVHRQCCTYLCHGLTNSPMRPVTPFTCGDGGAPNLAVKSSRVRPGGNSFGAKSVAIRVNV